VKQEWPTADADEFVSGIERAIYERENTPQGRQQMADMHFKTMRNGSFWILGGLALTFGTYEMASGGGSYFISYGPVAYGIYEVVKGFWGWNKYKS